VSLLLGNFYLSRKIKERRQMGGKQSHREVFSPFSDLFYFIFFFSKKRAGNIQKNSGNIYLRGSKYFECINDWNDRDKVNVCAARVIYIAEKKKKYYSDREISPP